MSGYVRRYILQSSSVQSDETLSQRLILQGFHFVFRLVVWTPLKDIHWDHYPKYSWTYNIHTQEHRHTWEVMFDISFFSVCCPFVMAAKASLSLWAKLTGLKNWCLCWHPSCTRRCPWRACRYVYTTNGECLRWRKTHQRFLRPLQNKNVKTCHFPSL